MKTKLRQWAVAGLVLATVMGGHAATYTITNAPGWNLIANQVDGANGNGIQIILPAANVPNGSRLMKFNLATKSFNPVEVRTISPASGQAIWQPGTNILNPGEGLMFSNAQTTTLLTTNTGNSHVPVLPLSIGSNLVLVARQTNDLASATNILGFTPPDFTAVYRFNPGAGRDPNTFAPPHYTIYTKKGGVWNPSSPVINVGESVWITTNGSLPTITNLSWNPACPGGVVYLVASASSTLPISYQWYHGSTLLSSGTNYYYTLSNIGNGDLGNYTVVVSNPFGSVTSAVINVSYLLPQVTGPSNALACIGGSATFTVAGDTTPPSYTYAWYKSGVLQPNATGNTFSVSPVTAADYGAYCVVVTGCASITNCATLSQGDPNPPVVRCPQDQVVLATGPDGAIVTFSVYAADQCSTNVTVTANPPSGSLFPLGTTPVLCKATDAAGNSSACTFNVVVLPAGCCDSKAWRQVAEGGPGPRQGHALAYDSARQRVVLFGGFGIQGLMGDTWEWDGATWKIMAEAGPSPRAYMAMAYDSGSGLTVLFGGSDGKTPMGDTWVWDGAIWKKLDASGPEARNYHTMAYDSDRKLTVLFGGVSAAGNNLGDVWEFDGQKWNPGPAGAVGPDPRAGAAMAYAAGMKQLLLFGGTAKAGYFGDTWQWDGTQWSLISTSGPSPRAFHAMAYDDGCSRVVLFGGTGQDGVLLDDTWTWDGSQWSLGSSGQPFARQRHAMAHDSARGQTILFGGASATGGAAGDTWARALDRTPAQIRSVYALCGGSQLTIAFGKPMDPVSASNPANYQVNCGGTPLTVTQVTLNEDARLVTLTVDPPFSVSTGCTLFLSNVQDQCGGVVQSAQFAIQCDRDACAKGSGGTEFWLTFPGNYAPDRANQPVLRLWITGAPGTIGSVAMPAYTNLVASFTIPGSGVFIMPLPRYADLANANDLIENKAVHVTASAKVNVYGYNHIRYTTDAFMGLSTAVLGKVYLVMSYKNMYNSVPELNGSQFAIAATADNTKVAIVPSSTVGSHAAGVPYLITLMRGQTYQLRNTNAAPADLTGTIILADQPIAVFGGHQCANLPTPNTFFCNYVVEQMFPADMWGTSFLTFPLGGRSGGDTFRFMALFNNTTVSVNGVPLGGLINQGQYKELQLSTGAQITSDKPILVAQFANSSDYDMVRNSDPFMVLVPPTVLYSSSYVVQSPLADFPYNYINVIVPAGSVGSATLDGSLIPAVLFTPIGLSGYSGAQVPVGTGAHTLSNSGVPFGVIVYGWAEYDAYGYPGGTCASKQGTTPPRFICPPEATSLTAGPGCVAAVPDLVSQVGNGDQAVFAAQSPPAGTLLGPGTYNVVVELLDRYGNRQVCVTLLRIFPSQNPGLQCPPDIIANCTTSTGAVVNFQVTVCNTNYTAISTPASGSFFPIGTTPVTCLVSNATGGIIDRCSFNVTVRCGGNVGPSMGIASVATPGTIRLTWQEGYQLQKASSVNGPWITISNVVSGAVLPLSGKQGYFRVAQ